MQNKNRIKKEWLGSVSHYLKNKYFLFSLLIATLATGSLQAKALQNYDANKASLLSKKLTEKPELDFSIQDGKIYNRFYRHGPVAAHTLLTSGTSPRLVVAFPAGNSGVSLWFKSVDTPVRWQEIDHVKAITQQSQSGKILYGIQAEITVDAEQITVAEAVLSNVRVIRNYLHTGKVPSSITNKVSIDGKSITWSRDRLDGQSSYHLAVDLIQGKVIGGNGQQVTFKAPEGQNLRMRLRALTGDMPLTPIKTDELLSNVAAVDSLSKNVLAFLSYKEKLLAGSWRFATYFGRDTLMSVRLLMPALSTSAIESGLGSVVERLSVNGEVAHEEDIGEFAIIRNMKNSGEAIANPFYDYKMIDDNYMLAPVVASYLLEHEDADTRASSFLKLKTGKGDTYGAMLMKNFHFVVHSARPYADTPDSTNLINFKKGYLVGEWRDSDEGPGNGIIPYDVNAVFVPAALSAIARLYDSGLLEHYLDKDDVIKEAVTLAKLWKQHSQKHFKVALSNKRAQELVRQYANKINIPSNAAIASLTEDSITFNALSLDSKGMPIPILHSDDGFNMLFGYPTAVELERSLQALFKPFPAGLLTPVGMVVANPAFANNELQQNFTNKHYHGAVIWSWQHAVIAAGLARQLKRSDLPQNILSQLAEAELQLWQVIKVAEKVNNAELWSWSFSDGQYQIESFGQRDGDKTESNAAQLWSTVYLGITQPSTTVITKFKAN